MTLAATQRLPEVSVLMAVYNPHARYFPEAVESILGLLKFRLAVAGLNFSVRLLYGCRLTDEATCYKAFPTALLRQLDLTPNRFEFCAEVTAKLCRLGIPIQEVPISYYPRTATHGKKSGWRDAWPTFWRGRNQTESVPGCHRLVRKNQLPDALDSALVDRHKAGSPPVYGSCTCRSIRGEVR